MLRRIEEGIFETSAKITGSQHRYAKKAVATSREATAHDKLLVEAHELEVVAVTDQRR